jgi:ABC-2 type transport system permease protein
MNTHQTKRHLGLLGEYFTQYLKVRVGYRGDFWIGLATSFAATVFALAFVFVLFRNVPRLADWTFYEIVFLYGFSLIPYGIFNVLSPNLYDFGSEFIMEGKFDRVLVRPVASLFQVIFENFRIESFQEIICGVIIVIWTGRYLRYHWTILDVVLLVVFALCGGAIYLAIFLILSTCSFWFEDRIGISAPVWNLIAFGRYPLSIYSGYIQFFLSWIVPFGFATFYPTVRLLHRTRFHYYAPFVPLVTAACIAIALWFWERGVRHYSSTGS